jgi:hypothetical protein
MGSLIPRPCSLALPGPCYPKLPLLRTTWSPPNEPLRPAKLGIHRHSRSLPGHTLRPAQACTISTLLRHVPKACHAGDPYTHNLCSTRTRPSGLCRPVWSLLDCAPHACTGLYDLHQDHALKACQAGNPQKLRFSTPLASATPPTCHLSQEGSKPA